jgi:hypothetical protein
LKQDIPDTDKTFLGFVFSAHAVRTTKLNLPDLATVTILGEGNKSVNLPLCNSHLIDTK